MKNSQSIIIAILFSIFALTSCQKENISDLSQDLTSKQLINTSRMTEATNFVNTDVATQYTVDLMKNKASSRSSSNDYLFCGIGPINDNTAGSDNAFDYRNTLCPTPEGDSFEGPDKSYLFLVEDSPGESIKHRISLTKLHFDVDLFVYALDRYGMPSECVGASITIGLDDEVLDLGDLGPGLYMVVVDAWHSSIVSAFELKYDCFSTPEIPTENENTLVNKVIAGDGLYNEVLATYIQVSPTQWKEIDTTGAVLNFREMGRNSDHIFLRNDYIGQELQLNLLTQKITYQNDDGNKGEMYDILTIGQDKDGDLPTTISYGKDGQIYGAYYKMGETGQWSDTSITDYFYNLLLGDETAIFLGTSEGELSLQLDLINRKVLYFEDWKLVEVYDIINVE